MDVSSHSIGHTFSHLIIHTNPEFTFFGCVKPSPLILGVSRIFFSLIVFGFLLIVIPSARAQAVSFSERVGIEIDAGEKRYFGLFYQIPDDEYISATASADGEETRLHLQLQWGDSTIVISDATADQLRIYLDAYESVIAREVEVDFSELTRIARPSPINVFPENVYVMKQDGKQVGGRLLYSGDRFLALWASDEPYDWREVRQNVRVVSVSEIDQIKTKRGFEKSWTPVFSGAAALGLQVGSALVGREIINRSALELGGQALLGSGLTLFAVTFLNRNEGERFYVGGRQENLIAQRQKLRRIELFNEHYVAPEFFHLLEEQLAVINEATAFSPRSSSIPFKRVHLAFGNTLTFLSENRFSRNYAYDIRFDPGLQYSEATEGRLIKSPLSLSMDVAYAWTARFRSGIDINHLLKPAIAFDKDYVYGTLIAGYAEYGVVGRTVAQSRQEIWIGLGVSYNIVYNRSSQLIELPPTFQPPQQPLAYSLKKSGLGLYARIIYDYYVSDVASWYVKAQGTTAIIDLPQRTYDHSYIGTTYRFGDMSGLRVKLALGLTAGMRIHL